MSKLSKRVVSKLILDKLDKDFGVTPQFATDKQFFLSVCAIVKDILIELRSKFIENTVKKGDKRVYYLSMEFLLGRSLKNSLSNLELESVFADVLSDFNVKLPSLYDMESDAGLGNGGLGRLAACYLDALATQKLPATGYSILYEYGIFKQKIVDGWQTELPDTWRRDGEVWLTPRYDQAVEVKFDGHISEIWQDGRHFVKHHDYNSVMAVPYDMYISGFSDGVSLLRLWSAKSESFDMGLFNSGNFLKALEQNAMAEVISKVLYPADNHLEGKILRLRQQYFMVCASVSDIVKNHLRQYKTLDNLAQKAAIHINDTHPALAIPELMRILLDECGYSWDHAFSIVKDTFHYTNHTVMQEALECWDEQLFSRILPRIYQIVQEINQRFCNEIYKQSGDFDKVSKMAILSYHQVRMANLCVAVCKNVNGVSKLHSQILKDSLFADFYAVTPEKFKNVTNGIAHRRWLYQSNKPLSDYLSALIGDGFITDSKQLLRLLEYRDDPEVLKRLGQIKRKNKENFSGYVARQTGVILDPDSIFDVQVKRLHEYKRQHLNLLHIISNYLYIKNNPQAPFVPHTYIFGAKAAPSYYFAKQIIRLICTMSKLMENDPQVYDKLKVVYMEDYRVTLSEILMPAADISEQISLAGTEASGTGNMKLMLNGAVTLGTLDGANIEIKEAVGEDNIITFGMNSLDVAACRAAGYRPQDYYNANQSIREVLDFIKSGIDGIDFSDIAENLLKSDPYMVLADFDSYAGACRKAVSLYEQPLTFGRMSLANIAGAGYFSADRSILEYKNTIWEL